MNNKEKIKYNKRKWLKNKMNSIIFHSICNIVILSILLVFISNQINKMIIVSGITKEIYISITYLGVYSISLLGAYLSVRIEEKIRCKKELKQIKENIKNQNDKNKPLNKSQSDSLNYNKKINNDFINVINQNTKPYTKIRKRNNNK